MPHALKSVGQLAPGIGSAVAGLLHVEPPSVLRQIPPLFVVWLSAQAVVITTWSFPGANLTSDMRNGCKPSRCDHVLPESVVFHSPPLSLAAIATAALLGL